VRLNEKREKKREKRRLRRVLYNAEKRKLIATRKMEE
jgi:hypothetical protein